MGGVEEYSGRVPEKLRAINGGRVGGKSENNKEVEGRRIAVELEEGSVMDDDEGRSPAHHHQHH